MSTTPFSAVFSALTDYLQAAVHSILFHRGLYPAHLFTDAQQWGVPVKASRSPAVNAYLQSVLNALGTPLSKGMLESVYLLVFDPSAPQVPEERYVFRVRYPHDVLQELSKSAGRGMIVPAAMSVVEAQFASALQVLVAKLPLLKRPAHESERTYRIAVDITDTVLRDQASWPSARFPLGQEWVTAAPELPDAELARETHNVILTSVKSVSMPLFEVETVIERFVVDT
ncbi:DNA-binding protein [Blastocladiella britannica]|nr:DNA-binding protein [Blastocladiella britannica]